MQTVGRRSFIAETDPRESSRRLPSS